MTENEFLTADRIAKIKSVNELYDLENKAYIAFSGGKDSTVLSELIDEALPGNNIPRVFINTGIEYKLILDFVREKQRQDSRIVIVNAGVNLRQLWETKGYPFKSKEHSEKLSLYQRSGMTKTVLNYIGKGTKTSFLCPKKLLYQFSDDFKIKVSKECCEELKKKPSAKWAKENGKSVTITGIRRGEGGLRASVQGCTVFDGKGLHKFHPMLPLEESWLDDYIKLHEIKLCKLYYPPYNFTRTGCVGCVYNTHIQRELDTMEKLLPTEKKRCEILWKPIYDEYRRINYRLRKGEKDEVF